MNINGIEFERDMMSNPADKEAYRRLVGEVEDGSTIMEIGVFEGSSLVAVSDIIKRKGLNIVAVDLFDALNKEIDGISVFSDGLLKRFMGYMRKADLRPTVICGESEDAFRAMMTKKFSLIFIDADHSYEGVKKDIANLWPLVKHGGVLAGHDYGINYPGVKQAVTEFISLNKLDDVRIEGEIWSVGK